MKVTNVITQYLKIEKLIRNLNKGRMVCYANLNEALLIGFFDIDILLIF